MLSTNIHVYAHIEAQHTHTHTHTPINEAPMEAPTQESKMQEPVN